MCVCVSADSYGDWSVAGCYQVDVSDPGDEIICHCDHLSNFAVLLVSGVALFGVCFVDSNRLCDIHGKHVKVGSFSKCNRFRWNNIK